MKHTSNIKCYDGTKEELSEGIGDLYYDSMAELLQLISRKIKADGDADLSRGRKKLANELYEAAESMNRASKNIENAWNICEPYVEEWLENNGKTRI